VTRHEPGSLVAALQCLASRGVNLSRLNSRPIAGRPFEYRFYLDFEVADPGVAEAALRDFEALTLELRLFGTFPAAIG
jgi:prephenate dehydratase